MKLEKFVLFVSPILTAAEVQQEAAARIEKIQAARAAEAVAAER